LFTIPTKIFRIQEQKSNRRVGHTYIKPLGSKLLPSTTLITDISKNSGIYSFKVFKIDIFMKSSIHNFVITKDFRMSNTNNNIYCVSYRE